MITTKQAERDRLIRELTLAALDGVRQGKIVEKAQAELQALYAERDRILAQLEALDTDTGSDA